MAFVRDFPSFVTVFSINQGVKVRRSTLQILSRMVESSISEPLCRGGGALEGPIDAAVGRP
jgi:hypothetical protein